VTACQLILQRRQGEETVTATAARWTCEECGYQNTGIEACEMCGETHHASSSSADGHPSIRMQWKWCGALASYILLGAATCFEPTSSFGGWFCMVILGLLIFVMIPSEIGWKIAVEGWNWRRHAAPVAYNAVQVVFFAYCVSFQAVELNHAADTPTRVAHGRFPGGLPAGVNGDVVESMWIAVKSSPLPAFCHPQHQHRHPHSSLSKTCRYPSRHPL